MWYNKFSAGLTREKNYVTLSVKNNILNDTFLSIFVS